MKLIKCLNKNNLNYFQYIRQNFINYNRFSSTTAKSGYEDNNSRKSTISQKKYNYINKENNLLLIQDTLKNTCKPLSILEWKSIRNKLMESENYINEINVDAIILGFLTNISSKNLNLAKSYIEFIKNEGLELNLACLGRLMKIYYFVYRTNNEQITDFDKLDILKIYNKIIQKHKILDAKTCENLIYGLVITNKWKLSLDLLNMIELTCKPSINTYSTIITRAFSLNYNANGDLIDNGDEDIGWKLLNEIVINHKSPKCDVFITYFKRLSQIYGDNKIEFTNNLEKMLKFIEKNEIIVTLNVINELQKILLENYQINSKITKLITSESGKCNSCKLKMKKITLNDDEFKSLSTSFLNKVLIRKDVFLKSLPEEIDKFIKFVDKTCPYDCVIDGLNVAFSSGTNKPPKVYAKLLSSVVKYFVDKNKKILVIGREHMNKWPKEHMKYVKSNTDLFLTTNLSHDDPFLLYAALKSGPKTDILSRDLMRSHAFLLGNALKPLFRRWQIEHQYMLLQANENGKVLIKEPIKHYITAHKVNSTWHIPFTEVYVPNPPDIHEVPSNWLCLPLKKTTE